MGGIPYIEISNFCGLDDLKGNQFASDKTISAIVDGKNFTIVNGIPEIAKTPFKLDIGIQEDDKINAIEGKFIVNGFKKVILAKYAYTIYIINGWIYEYKNGGLHKIYDTQLDVSAICSFTVYAKRLVIFNDIDNPIEFDGTVCSVQKLNDPHKVVETGAIFSGAEVANNKIYYYTDDTIFQPQPQTTSNFDNETSMVDAIRVNAPNGGKIVSIKQLAGKILIVFLQNKQILRLSGSQPFSATATDPHMLSPITDQIGGISPRSVVNVGTDEMFFISNRGLEKLSTVSAFGELSCSNVFEKIKDRISYFLNDEVFHKYCSVCYLKDKIHVLFRTGTTSVLYSYNIATADIETSEYEQCFTYMDVIDDVLTFGCDDGFVYRIMENYYNHKEAFIEFNFYPSKYGMGVLKKWSKLLVFIETSTFFDGFRLEVEHIKRDYVNELVNKRDKKIAVAAVWDSSKWDKVKWDSKGIKLVRFKNLGKSKAIKLRLYAINPQQHFKLKQLQLYYLPYGNVKG